ncbi:MAG: hypothetical protein AAF843_15490 [Bacteroidota bacterium]
MITNTSTSDPNGISVDVTVNGNTQSLAVLNNQANVLTFLEITGLSSVDIVMQRSSGSSRNAIVNAIVIREYSPS